MLIDKNYISLLYILRRCMNGKLVKQTKSLNFFGIRTIFLSKKNHETPLQLFENSTVESVQPQMISFFFSQG